MATEGIHNGDEQETLSVRYSLTDEDLSAFLKFAAAPATPVKPRPSRAERRRRRATANFFAWWIGLFALLFLVAFDEARAGILRFLDPLYPLVISAGLGISLTLLGLILVFHVFGQRRTAVLRARVRGPRTVTLSVGGVTSEGENWTALLKWAIVQRVAETENHLFLFIDSLEGMVVPRRVFADESNWQAFVGLARHYHELHGPGTPNTRSVPPEATHPTAGSPT